MMEGGAAFKIQHPALLIRRDNVEYIPSVCGFVALNRRNENGLARLWQSLELRQVGAGVDVVGISEQGLLKVINGLLNPACAGESIGEIRVGQGKMRIELQGLLVVIDGLGRPA